MTNNERLEKIRTEIDELPKLLIKDGKGDMDVWCSVSKVFEIIKKNQKEKVRG